MSLNARVGKTYPHDTRNVPLSWHWKTYRIRFPATVRLMGRA